jgi:hypothetical protein
MWSGWRHILRIRLTIAAKSPRSGHALFKGYETAIRAAATLPAVIRAPRIVLRLGGRSDAEDGYENPGNEQRKFHGRIQWPPMPKTPAHAFCFLVRGAQDRGQYRQAADLMRKTMAIDLELRKLLQMASEAATRWSYKKRLNVAALWL